MSIDWASWIGLAIRWLHLITGIAWIGSSFYFVWLDNNLRKGPATKEGEAGELWAVHGGGFYHNKKYLVAPDDLPDHLHWFKYEAYFTWISGFLLLGVVYYYGAELYLIDRTKADLSQMEAIGLGLGSLAVSWLVYDGLCKSPVGRNNRLLGILWFGILTGAAYGLSQIFSGRGAYIHVGAMVGSAMVANVFFIIIPNQKKAVKAMLAGKRPDPALGIAAKQRSLHNNYMTLPVLFIMVSNHYPMTFSNPYGWAVLAGIALSGITIRHFFNLRHRGEVKTGLIFLGVLIFVLTMIFAADMQHRQSQALAPKNAVTYADVAPLISKHCTACHAAQPTHEYFDVAPSGVMLETKAQIQQYADRVRAQAVDADMMPLGNETGMTMEERAILGAWINSLDAEKAANGAGQ
ncbi:membrane protein [Iodidimonas gelatinilytica]|uniref:Membrane protein n=1 Tax=Iodidimonas gelatinilytica TaxID=1236966 RepID=A0A5A7MWH1_9PROT|nr:urate hydroxylase PuuD [Iodidimonas gelatinilytica]GER00403.1 membrane protein [Iodidimonas gelatinilytica]